MKFAAGVTLYNPSLRELELISEYGKSFETVIIFDNSEPDYEKPQFDFGYKFTFISKGKNVGLSVAFNSIINHKECQDVDFLCTLDQDSIFDAADIAKIKQFLENYQDIMNVGIVAPFIDYGYKKNKYDKGIQEKKWVITSGSFINLNIVRDKGLTYDELYFIDKFEIDFCQQMLKENKKIFMFCESILHQNLGEKSGHRHPNHSPLRHYYLFRNRFYFNQKWFGKSKCLLLDILQTLKHIGLIVLFEHNKLAKIRVLPQAFYDYKKNNMGKKSDG